MGRKPKPNQGGAKPNLVKRRKILKLLNERKRAFSELVRDSGYSEVSIRSYLKLFREKGLVKVSSKKVRVPGERNMRKRFKLVKNSSTIDEINKILGEKIVIRTETKLDKIVDNLLRSKDLDIRMRFISTLLGGVSKTHTEILRGANINTSISKTIQTELLGEKILISEKQRNGRTKYSLNMKNPLTKRYILRLIPELSTTPKVTEINIIKKEPVAKKAPKLTPERKKFGDFMDKLKLRKGIVKKTDA